MRKRSRFRIKTIEIFVVYLKLDVPPSFPLGLVVLPLQEFVGMYSNLDVPPLFGPAGISPTTQLGTNLYKIIRRSRGRHSALA